MKFTISSSKLFSQLQAVSRVINSKNALPILDDVLFDLAVAPHPALDVV